MDARIQSLINPILLGRGSHEEGLFQRALPSQRPTPVEPHYTIEEPRTGPESGLHGRISLHQPPNTTRAGTGVRLQPLRPRPSAPSSRNEDGKVPVGGGGSTHSWTLRTWSKHTVPIAEVLNQPENDERTTGSLSDILINSARKRKRNDEPLGADASNTSEQLNRTSQANRDSSLLTLPKPQTLKKKTSRRLPPLLQGLHQPPPDAGLFPRITEKEEHAERGVTMTVPEKKQSQPLLLPRLLEKEKALPKPEPPKSEPSSQDKSNPTSEPSNAFTSIDPDEKLKRSKWSDQETADLLKGVAKFGIGRWKKILDCNEYKFSRRSAVDLKDRFRTCRPSDYRTNMRPLLPAPPAQPAEPAGQAQSFSAQPIPIQQSPIQQSPIQRSPIQRSPIQRSPIQRSPVQRSPIPTMPERPKKKPRSGTHRKGNEDLAKIGIGEPFTKTTRRERRLFSKKEDEELLQGFIKYGSKWFLIKNDPDFCLGNRHPTDLRDRFRYRYPDKYITRSKPKKALEATDNEGLDRPESGTSNIRSDPSPTGQINENAPQSSTVPAAPTVSTSKAAPTSHPSLHALTTHFPEMNLPPCTEDSGNDYSPVTLSRNILNWPDPHLPNTSSLHAPLSMTTTEQNPTFSHSTTSSMSHGITMSMLMSNDPFSPTNPPMPSTMYTSAPMNHSSNRTQYAHGLPSLSTLTLSSAVHSRGPTLNLPTPSDILSGYDDGRLDSHIHFFGDTNL